MLFQILDIGQLTDGSPILTVIYHNSIIQIRRNVSHYGDDSQPGPSNRPEPILPTYPIVDPIPPPVPFDEQSAVSSREPSYRYITMR